jgi:hypothetical protein
MESRKTMSERFPPPFLLRATKSTARLWRDDGKPQKARELLASIYRWFTEGFDTRDLSVEGVDDFGDV